MTTKGTVELAASLLIALALASCSKGPYEGPIEGMTFVKVPSGSFVMGSHGGEPGHWDVESPQHEVDIETFQLMQTEVTQGMWEEVMGTTINDQKLLAYEDLGLWGVGPDYPMYYVSWEDAQRFVYELNQIDQEFEYRLPTEAEWEYACRAETETRFYWGNDPDSSQISSYAWHKGNAEETETVNPVGLKMPNQWELYDMSGNVWEIVADKWHDDYTGAPQNGSAWMNVDLPVSIKRGGSWLSETRLCRSACRISDGSEYGKIDVGFRLARVPIYSLVQQ